MPNITTYLTDPEYAIFRKHEHALRPKIQQAVIKIIKEIQER